MNLVDRLSGRAWTRIGWALGAVALVVLTLLVVDGVDDGRAVDAGECRGAGTEGCLTRVEGTAELVGTRRSRYTYQLDDVRFTLDRSDRTELGVTSSEDVDDLVVLAHESSAVVVESSTGRVELATRGWGQAGLAGLGVAVVLVLMAGALLPGRSERKGRTLAGVVAGLYVVGGPLVLLGVPLVGAFAAAAGGALLGALIGWSTVVPTTGSPDRSVRPWSGGSDQG